MGPAAFATIKVMVLSHLSPLLLVGMGYVKLLEGNLAKSIRSLKYSHALRPNSSFEESLTARVRNEH